MAERDEKNSQVNTTKAEMGYREYTSDSDELDIFATFGLLAKHAGKIKLAAIVSIALIGVFFAIFTVKASEERYYRYQMEIGLHFDGINDKLYPNGKNFNPNDIVSPDVLKIIYDKYKLDSIDFEQFVNAFSSSYKNVHRIPQEIKPVIGEEKTGSETEEGKLKKTKTVEIINPSEVVINMDVHSETKSLKQLPDNVLESVFNDIPIVWGKKFNNKYLKLNIPNPLRVIKFDDLPAMEYGDTYETLNKNLQLFIDGVAKIESQNIDLSSFKSAKLELTLEEAFFYVKNNLSRQLSAWYSMPQSFGIYKDENKRKAFLKNQHFDLETNRKMLFQTNKALGETLDRIRNPRGQTTGTSMNGRRMQEKSPASFNGDNRAPAPNINDSLLERIYRAGQSGQDKEIEYVQKLTDTYLSGIKEIASTEQEMTMVEKEIKNLSKARENISKKRKDALIKEIDIELAKLIEEYQKWISVCIEIAEESIESEAMRYGGIYTAVSPMEKTYINPLAAKKLMKTYFIFPGFLIAFAFFGYCISLIIREGFQKYKEEHPKT